jgi:hypothetical protein
VNECSNTVMSSTEHEPQLTFCEYRERDAEDLDERAWLFLDSVVARQVYFASSCAILRRNHTSVQLAVGDFNTDVNRRPRLANRGH